jgi:fructuronate reductase
LRRRRALGLPPFTVLCCDNLPANGRTVKRVIARLASLVDRELGRFVEAEVACPCTMVDRIVPATTDEARERISATLGVTDAWPVVTEPFSQWVIEDDFPQGRPAWETAGAQFARDVAPFELMKLRMLNGAHSTMAYLGYLAGHEFVADAASDPAFERLVRALWAEITPTVPPVEGVSLADYAEQLMQRFRNPTLRHRLWQIAMDGSQKLPQRHLATIRDRLRMGGTIDALALGVAGWARYVAGVDEQGRPIDVRDPLADRLALAMQGFEDDPETALQRLLAIRDVFGDDLPREPRFVDALVASFRQLVRSGSRDTINMHPLFI